MVDPDFDLSLGLPDARCSHWRPTFCGPAGIMSRVYCVNCGADGGLITESWARHVFYLCEKCAETVGHLSCPEIPEAAVRGLK